MLLVLVHAVLRNGFSTCRNLGRQRNDSKDRDVAPLIGCGFHNWHLILISYLMFLIHSLWHSFHWKQLLPERNQDINHKF